MKLYKKGNLLYGITFPYDNRSNPRTAHRIQNLPTKTRDVCIMQDYQPEKPHA